LADATCEPLPGSCEAFKQETLAQSGDALFAPKRDVVREPRPLESREGRLLALPPE
jgi:hypothetical protein